MIYEYFRSKLKEVLFKVPEFFPVEFYEDQIPIERDRPFHTLLIKEIQRYNLLMTCVKENLSKTLAAMEGLRQHDSETEQTFECL